MDIHGGLAFRREIHWTGMAHCIHFKQYLLFIRCPLCGFGHSEISDISIFMWRLHANESNSKF
jgi:hypothetical protein